MRAWISAAILGGLAITCHARDVLMRMEIEKADQGDAGIAVTTTAISSSSTTTIMADLPPSARSSRRRSGSRNSPRYNPRVVQSRI
jgi:hypothetical protein